MEGANGHRSPGRRLPPCIPHSGGRCTLVVGVQIVNRSSRWRQHALLTSVFISACCGWAQHHTLTSVTKAIGRLVAGVAFIMLVGLASHTGLHEVVRCSNAKARLSHAIDT